ncbi:MAG TPA: glutathione S-transferase C-terminal domain-containing protein, partial [Gammaproteobacteria bacterium]
MNDIKRESGWEIEDAPDPVFGASLIKEIYEAADPGADHRPAVPLLVNVKTRTLASTESPAILRYIATGFAGREHVRIDLCPDDLREEINALNRWLHDHINRAVYTVGFAREQSDYENQAFALFRDLDTLNERLSGSTFLFGDRLTESDLFLYGTLRRFDIVYGPLFRCSLKRVADYGGLSRFVANIAEQPGMSESFNRARTKIHYFKSLIHSPAGTLDPNPSGVVPI